MRTSEAQSVDLQPRAEGARAVEDPPEWVHLTESIRMSSQQVFSETRSHRKLVQSVFSFWEAPKIYSIQ